MRAKWEPASTDESFRSAQIFLGLNFDLGLDVSLWMIEHEWELSLWLTDGDKHIDGSFSIPLINLIKAELGDANGWINEESPVALRELASCFEDLARSIRQRADEMIREAKGKI